MKKIIIGSIAGFFLVLTLVIAFSEKNVQTAVGAVPYPNVPVNVGNYFRIGSTTTLTQIATGTGVLYNVVVDYPVAGSVIQFYDGLSTTTSPASTLISSTTLPTSPQPVSFTFDVSYTKGLEIVQTGQASDITVNFR